MNGEKQGESGGREGEKEKKKILLLNTEVKQLTEEINLISFHFSMCIICSTRTLMVRTNYFIEVLKYILLT